MNSFEDYPDWIIEKWQDIANILAETIGIPAVLIMKKEMEFLELLVSNKSENNPYKVGLKESESGHYCETVIKSQKKLLVPNATKDKVWKHNPDIKLGMIAYLGFPINFPDNQPFGTICVLDNKERMFNSLNERLILQFKNVIELDLAILQSYDFKTNQLRGNVLQEIADHKQTEAALRESEERFRTIIETIPLAVYFFTGPEQVCEYLNPKFVELFGYTLEDIPTIKKWWPLAYPDENYRKHVSFEWTKRVQHAIETQSNIEPMNSIVRCKDGSKKNIQWGYITLREKSYAYGLDLTGQNLAEKALKQSEEKYRMLSEHFAGGVSLFENNKVQYISEGYLKILGYEKHEIEGITFESIFSFIHHDDVAHIIKTIETAYQLHTEQIQYSFRIKNKQGSYLWMEDVVYLEYDSSGNHIRSIIYSRDITERKLAEEALKESEQRYRMLFNKANEGLILLTMDGKIAELNQSFAQMHGYTIDEMKQMDIKKLDVLGEASFDARSAVMKRLYAGEVVRFDVEHYHKNGHSFFLSDTVSIITIGDQKYFLAFHQDITERKKAEKEIQKRIDDLERFHNVVLEREIRMIELKQEVNELAKKLGEEKRYSW